MMKHLILSILALLLCCTDGHAQGVMVYLKDGRTISVPSEELDSICTYDEDAELDDEVLDFVVKGVSFRMILVKTGTFMMGSETDHSHSFVPGVPVHEVTLTRDYYIGETEVTQALWEAVTGLTPTASGWHWREDIGLGADYPAYFIGYNDALSFISRLNILTGQAFRLPTEAEWEYAARGGHQTMGYRWSGSDDADAVAWHKANSGDRLHEVKQKRPNELGIYDMSGNIEEWCHDWNYEYPATPVVDPWGPSSGSWRMVRGGYYNTDAESCTSASRNIYEPTFNYANNGFRLALYVQQRTVLP